VRKADDSPILSSLFFGPDEKYPAKLCKIREKIIKMTTSGTHISLLY
jgi:hypothetical protein